MEGMSTDMVMHMVLVWKVGRCRHVVQCEGMSTDMVMHMVLVWKV